MAAEITHHRDPCGSRAAVLDAAERLFADRGFSAATIRDISTASGVSHPLIHHHFGTKDDLYRAVRLRVVASYAEQSGRSASQPIGVAAEMRRLFKFLEANRQRLRFCARARLDGDEPVWPGEPDLIETLRKRIGQARDRGLVRNDLDPANLALIMVGLVYFWLENRECIARRTGKEPDDRAYLRQAIGLVLRGSAPDP